MKPTYFDFTVRDVARAKSFFETVLGWRFQNFDMPYEYHRIQAGRANEPGIDGGIGAIKDAPLSEVRHKSLFQSRASVKRSHVLSLEAAAWSSNEYQSLASAGTQPAPNPVASSSASSKQSRRPSESLGADPGRITPRWC